MKKEREHLFDDVKINTVQMAKDIITESEEKLKRVKRGMTIGAVATCGTVIGLILISIESSISFMGEIILAVTSILSIISYIIGGGIGSAFKLAWKLCKISWYIIPIPLVDIMLAIMVFGCSLFGALYVPILFVWLDSRQIQKNIEEAEKFLTYVKE